MGGIGMNILLSVVTQVLHIVLVLLAAPLLTGLAGVLSHWLAGREGPPVAQPWRDLVRLFRKQIVPKAHPSSRASHRCCRLLLPSCA
jgi:formate hydrogenlyase subunit 4